MNCSNCQGPKAACCIAPRPRERYQAHRLAGRAYNQESLGVWCYHCGKELAPDTCLCRPTTPGAGTVRGQFRIVR